MAMAVDEEPGPDFPEDPDADEGFAALGLGRKADHDEDEEDEDEEDGRRLQFWDPKHPQIKMRMSRSWRELPKWDDGPLAESMGPMPRDPITNCHPNKKGMKVIHEASIIIPELMPKLVTYMAVHILLVVPVIILSCLGFWWGNDLYGKLGQGYGQLANSRAQTVPHIEVPAPAVPQLAEVHMAPVQATTVATNQAE